MTEPRDVAPAFTGNEIAIIGMAGRFPKSPSLEEFWQNLCNGVECVTFYDRDELIGAGVPATLVDQQDYVRASIPLENMDLFDAEYFGYSAGEARILDPQQRLFLECAVHALEHAGHDPQRFLGPIGVYGSTGAASYLLFNVLRNHQIVDFSPMYQLLYGSEKDFLCTRVSYKLGLRGPSVSVQTACSSSLVAVHLACQSLLTGECDLALAGGVSLNALPYRGYRFAREGYFSPDGHCRPFDARAEGTLAGSGVGLVVLRRLRDALNDTDSIYAIIRGTAINNDGALKMGYSAPSVQGQATAVSDALAVAGVHPDTIGYIEAHGTGTPIGDPIEMTALRQVYEAATDRKGFCAIGSIKSNMGHLDAAAGIAGLLKTTLALHHQLLPPHLHYERPNPRIDFDSSPFYVNTRLRPWPRHHAPRRAGVSAFGIGGTNAHVVLEEAPIVSSERSPRTWHLLPLSAKSDTALAIAQRNLAAHLRAHQVAGTPPALADVAHTLQVGRRVLPHRSFTVCRSIDDAAQQLDSPLPGALARGHEERTDRRIAFLFPGGGAQHVNMGRDLYREEPRFRATVDRCLRLLAPRVPFDPLALLYPPGDATDPSTEAALPLALLFTVEYALADLLINRGIRPCALLGHSMGEYVAACLAGVFTVEDALRFIAERERHAADLPSGAMLSVLATEQELVPLLHGPLSLAAVNSGAQCVVSGPVDAIEALEGVLRARDLFFLRVNVATAGHSALLEPILPRIRTTLAGMTLHAPAIPFISNLTGNWAQADEVTSPEYWLRHLRHTVRFSDGVHTLLVDPDIILLELGPGQTLSLLIKSILTHRPLPDGARVPTVINAMRERADSNSDVRCLLTALGQLWLAGGEVDWEAFAGDEPRRRIPLPGYPFQRRRYWIEPDSPGLPPPAVVAEIRQPDELGTDAADATSSTPPTLPENELEETLAIIWREVLGVDHIGVRQSFFELGGDSLIGLRLVTRVRETFNIDLPLRTFFENPTIADLAGVIDEQVLSALEALSDSEIQELLAQELGRG